MFTVTKKFTTGLLAGLVIEETTSVEFQVGFEAKPSSITPSGYVVIACQKAGA